MTTDATSPGAARIMKTARVQHTVTSDEAAQFFFEQDVAWPHPFVDTNYTAVCTISAAVVDSNKDAFVDHHSKAVDKITVLIDLSNPVAGDIWTVEALAIHD